MTNEEIMKLVKEHEERKTSGKPFTDEEYAEADAEDKAKMDDYAEFCAYLAERQIKRGDIVTRVVLQVLNVLIFQ